MEKCICGHVKASEWELNTLNGVTNDMVNAEEFIRIVGTFYANSGGYCSDRKVDLYACPECGTVKMVN